MKWKNLQAYLKEKKVDKSTSKEETEQHKKEYWSMYAKDYEVDRSKQKRIYLRPTKQEYQELEQKAALAKISVSRYALDAALAYGSSGYIMPGTEGLDKLIKELNHIGHNINTVVKKMHSLSNYTDAFHYEQLREEFKKVDGLILSYLTTPIKEEETEKDDY